MNFDDNNTNELDLAIDDIEEVDSIENIIEEGKNIIKEHEENENNKYFDSNYWKQTLSNKEKDEMNKLIYLLEIN